MERRLAAILATVARHEGVVFVEHPFVRYIGAVEPYNRER